MKFLFGNNNALSSIKYPFKLSCISSIRISYFKTLLGHDKFVGLVEFQNGNTNGQQKFEGKDLVDAFMQVKAFCDSLEQNEK